VREGAQSQVLTVVRLQKFLAEAGVASRRASEQIILAGRVAVNGETVSELGAQGGSGARFESRSTASRSSPGGKSIWR